MGDNLSEGSVRKETIRVSAKRIDVSVKSRAMWESCKLAFGLLPLPFALLRTVLVVGCRPSLSGYERSAMTPQTVPLSSGVDTWWTRGGTFFGTFFTDL